MSNHKPSKQNYPIGTPVEVRMNGTWHPATVHGQAGDYIIARSPTYWYDEYADEDVRPIRSERDQWVESAVNMHSAHQWTAESFAVVIYDALKSGDLKAPEVDI